MFRMALTVLMLGGAALAAPDLAPPFQVVAGDEPIDVDLGHAAPCFVDLDGDGLRDLLVGQFEGGKLRIYRNVGDTDEPRFEGFHWFQGGGPKGTVPSG